MNECIRFNTSVSTADKAVFGLSPRDGIRTPAQAPTETGSVNVKRLGAFEYEAVVIDEKTSKRKLPENATSCASSRPNWASRRTSTSAMPTGADRKARPDR
jgi:hypothetical protein